MDSNSVEVRLFVQHLIEWLGSFSQQHIPECHDAIERLSERGRILCAHPEFKRMLEAHQRESGGEAPEAAINAMCSILAALTATTPYSHYRNGV